MGKDDYIKKLVGGIRGEINPPNKEKADAVKSRNLTGAEMDGSKISGLLKSIRNYEVKGDSKRLIRIDSKTEEVLKLLNPLFKIHVTSFVNFLCKDFLDRNPELIEEINQSLKKL